MPTKKLVKSEPGRSFHHKTRICVEQDLFHDILKCIITYGFDYKFFQGHAKLNIDDPESYIAQGGKNLLLRIYLQKGKALSNYDVTVLAFHKSQNPTPK